MADAICRWRNGTPKTVVELANSIPHNRMPVDEFRAFMEDKWNGDFFRTPYQLACQLGLYCEAEDGYYYPRFNHDINEKEAEDYLFFWLPRYYIPNPYTRKDGFQDIDCPTFFLKELYDYTQRHPNCSYKDAYESCFHETAKNNDDIVRNYINSYSQVLSFSKDGLLNITDVNPQNLFTDMDKNNKKAFFDNFNFTTNKETFRVNVDYGPYLPFITALRTKPFLLLAGISGTGKSQKVQELAFMTCPGGELRNEGGTAPGNYCLVEVKPNWHDSTELLGYYSALSGKYELTDFIRFAYKASQNEDVPFFLCLDEMNLAPVEQYFAEFLSVLETRKKVGNEILTQYLLSKDRFSNCELQKKVLVKEDGDIIEGDKQYKMEFLYSEKDAEIITYLKEKGLTLPDNLFVIGTVNMDDTTHQFSRKVIDRAFTIEMNGGKMSEMFSLESKMLLEYRDEPIPLEAFKAEFVRAYEVLDDTRFAKYKDVISTHIPALLGDSDGTAEADSINGILNETPFRVSYRVQNELVLYLSTLIERANFPEPDQIEGLIGEATLAILLEKVLPRVQGEQKQLETQNGKSNVLKDLKTFVESHFKPEEDTDANSIYNQVLRKLKEMDDKLANYYTNFF